ncbi:hypothetical protein EJB05_56979, partial [Eragrostis curvula]
MKQLKERFQKIKRWVGMFCGSWKKACSIYTSGQSDDMLKEKALSFYLADFQEGPFTVMHCWRMLRNEPKWHVILEDMDNSNKRRLDSKGELKDGESEYPKEKRPMGTKRTKKLRNAKGKGDAKSDETELDDDMKKFMEIQQLVADYFAVKGLMNSLWLINRNREGAHEQLVADYFAADPLYPDTMFRRRFRRGSMPFCVL